MSALLDWIKKIIVSVVKFLIAILSAIVNALEPNGLEYKGHRLKRVIIGLNSDGQITVKSVNGIRFDEFFEKKRLFDEEVKSQVAPPDNDSQPAFATRAFKIGDKCYEIVSNDLGGLICIPLQNCP